MTANNRAFVNEQFWMASLLGSVADLSRAIYENNDEAFEIALASIRNTCELWIANRKADKDRRNMANM